jgi:hypothetical protein
MAMALPLFFAYSAEFKESDACPEFSRNGAVNVQLCHPQSVVVAGESTCKSALLLRYAYNAAARGLPSLYFKRRSESLPSLSFSGSDDAHEEEALQRICFKYVDSTSQIRCVGLFYIDDLYSELL